MNMPMDKYIEVTSIDNPYFTQIQVKKFSKLLNGGRGRTVLARRVDENDEIIEVAGLRLEGGH